MHSSVEKITTNHCQGSTTTFKYNLKARLIVAAYSYIRPSIEQFVLTVLFVIVVVVGFPSKWISPKALKKGHTIQPMVTVDFTQSRVVSVYSLSS